MYINNPGHMTKIAAMSLYGKNLQKSSSPQTVDQFQVFNKTWHVALWTRVLHVYTNYDPVMTLTFFYSKVNIGHP